MPPRLHACLMLVLTPVAAVSGDHCLDWFDERAFDAVPMLSIEGDVVTGVDSFPLFATGDSLAYVACPVTPLPPENPAHEGTACHAGLLVRADDGVLRERWRQAVPGCGAADFWNPDCPDFGAEGLTAANRLKLQQAVARAAPRLCGQIPAGGEIHGIRAPAAPPDPRIAGTGDRGYRLTGHCAGDGTPGQATHAACPILDLAVPAPDGERAVLGFTRLLAGKASYLCAVADDGSLQACVPSTVTDTP